jgi:hypothetical protein
MAAFRPPERLGGNTWSTRFRIRQYLKGSIWLVPFMGGVLGAVLGLLEPRVDESVSLPQAWQ